MRDHAKATTYKAPTDRARHVLQNPGAHPAHQISNAAKYLISHSDDEAEASLCRALVAAVARRPEPVLGISRTACAFMVCAAFIGGALTMAASIP